MSFVLALAITALCLPGMIALAWRLGWLAQPRHNRWHQRPTALMGGVPIAIGLAASWGFTGVDPLLALVLAGLFVVGVVDDRLYELFPVHKLLAQVTAAGLLVAVGWVPAGIPHPWAGLLAVVWLVGLSNAVNLLDNMDGLAAGVVGIASTALAAIAATHGDHRTATVALGLTGACAAFLLFNFRFTTRPARIFMGDCGSLPLGMALGALALRATHAPGSQLAAAYWPWVPALLVLAVPLLDTGLVSWCRWRAGRPVLPGAADHLSHRLVRLGMTDRGAVLLHYLFALGWAGAALLLVTGAPGAIPAVAVLSLTTVAGAWKLAAVPIYAPPASSSAPHSERAGRGLTADHTYEGAHSA